MFDNDSHFGKAEKCLRTLKGAFLGGKATVPLRQGVSIGSIGDCLHDVSVYTYPSQVMNSLGPQMIYPVPEGIRKSSAPTVLLSSSGRSAGRGRFYSVDAQAPLP